MRGIHRSGLPRVASAAMAWVLVAGIATPALAEDNVSEAKAPELEAIVVTAQKREQRLQDVGTSVAVIGAKEVTKLGLTDQTSFVQHTVGVQLIEFSPAVTQLSIRGVSQASFADHLEGPVAVYVDDGYIGFNGGVAGSLFDIDRIEVLRGPQGTLFGRNATGGLIHYVTKKPTSALEGYTSVSVAEYGEVNAQGAIGGRIYGDLLGRLSVDYSHADGYLKDTTGPTTPRQRNVAVRGQLSKSFGENTDVWLGLHASQDYGPVDAYMNQAAYPLASGLGRLVGPNENPWNTCTGCDAFGYKFPDAKSWTRTSDGPHSFDRRVLGATLKVTSKFGDVNFTSVSDVYSLKKFYQEDSDSSPNGLFNYTTNQKATQLSQELRFDGKSDVLQWVGGAYFLKMDSNNYVRGQSPAYAFDYATQYTQKTSSESIFGQVEYKLDDKLKAILGARYSFDQKSIDLDQFDLTQPLASQVTLQYNPSTYAAAKRNFDGFSGKAELDYRVQPDWLIYGSVNRGYKGGNWNTPAFPSDPNTFAHNAEKLTSFEIGSKSSSNGGRLRINASAFYYDYKGYQSFSLENGVTSLFNRDARLFGGEVEVTLVPVHGLTLTAGYAGIDTKIKGIQLPDGSIVDRKMPTSPAASLTGLIRYEWTALDGVFAIQGDGKRDASQFFSPLNNPDELQGPQFIANARASYTRKTAGQTWELAVFARNVTNSLYSVYRADSSGFGFVNIVYAPPRVFGASLRVDFR